MFRVQSSEITCLNLVLANINQNLVIFDNLDFALIVLALLQLVTSSRCTPVPARVDSASAPCDPKQLAVKDSG